MWNRSSVKPPPNPANETFTLAEGPVYITYPSVLSEASLKDLKDYLDIFLRKVQRVGHDPVDEMLPDKRAMAG